jgi:curved DNA-binding protein CbpA
MPVNDYQLAELRHAYQVLGVPPDTSAPSIKKTYRRLVKRWHPAQDGKIKTAGAISLRR